MRLSFKQLVAHFFSYIFIYFFTSNLSAAAPVTHAYLSECFFQYYPQYSPEERKAFMVGTLFADIRYLGAASRQHTHFDNTTLQDVLNEKSPFLAGLKFHSYVDLERERFVIKQNIYNHIINISPLHETTFLKFLEDEIVFYTYDWSKWVEALKNIYPEELSWGMDETAIRKWHNLLTLTLINPPSTLIFLASSTSLNILDNYPKHWNKIMSAALDSPEVKNFVQAMRDHFDCAMKPIPKVDSLQAQ